MGGGGSRAIQASDWPQDARSSRRSLQPILGWRCASSPGASKGAGRSKVALSAELPIELKTPHSSAMHKLVSKPCSDMYLCKNPGAFDNLHLLPKQASRHASNACMWLSRQMTLSLTHSDLGCKTLLCCNLPMCQTELCDALYNVCSLITSSL